ncbi:hypothetical protein [Mycoplasma suis]|uniref:Uncharacterized protein n=1 Tax=Mycoplasma suis (strain Illinois) TaxID=768700 RepID=F0QQL1_MYCSL|nr:hypothetical protein [Mycoplasma suis]ADX97781.1 hypothetical protein MSU_0237 [Mycoplasma suis str. Illinois]
MGIISLTKGIVTLSTVGGTLIGSYFATNTLSNSEKESPAQVVSVDNGGSVGAVKKDSEELRGKEEAEQSKSISSDSSEGTREIKNPAKTEDSSPEVKENSNTSAEDSSQQEGERRDISGKEIQFTDESLRSEDTSSSDISSSEEEDNTENLEVIEEEPKEVFDNFDDYEEDDLDDDEEETRIQLSMIVGEYIAKLQENDNGDVLEVSCDNWIRESDQRIGKRKVEEETCKSRKNRSSWGKGGRISQPTVWLEVEKSKSKEILNHYGLWRDGISKFSDTEKAKWNTRDKDNNGNWSCSRETCQQNKKKFLISCDLFAEQNK